ncbi:MAG: hypothetical protein H5U36_04885 [Candidatus Caldatribacterium sp.]|nr:hypothetical protein [Candidatus Caldatribacterium sp.]
MQGARVEGEALYFSFARREGWVEKANLLYSLRERGELFFRGRRLAYIQGTWKGNDVLCTGCRREPPLVSLRAKEVTVFPQGKVVIEGLALYIRDRKILEIPWYTKTLGRGGGSFLPALGFSRQRGWYTGFRYEYAFSPEVLFLARYTIATQGGQLLQTDITINGENLKGQVFWDTRFSGNDTVGIAASLKKGDFSLLVIATRNEAVNSQTLSRSPQIVASFTESLSDTFTLSGAFSYGYFATETFSSPRFDARLTLSFKEENFGAKIFGWGTWLDGGYLGRFGGEAFWEKDLSPNFWARFSLRFVEGDYSPFFFDLQPESLASFEFLWGEEEGSFLHIRGRYDLRAQGFRDWTVGIGLGNENISFGVEGVYAQGSFTERRYFLRKRIEDCAEVEMSFLDPEGSFFVALNLSGFDASRRAESLFEEEEPFDPLGFKRDLDTP